ncbi:pterin-4-alpha-carbinolamine dehydratase 2, mitochondrial isoform X1 [Nymphaea colorata]|nr:pterin-4-alpha-carbinolamine dehydratase 2, mitochondrial isoform X1 [Nymphaea colorata]
MSAALRPRLFLRLSEIWSGIEGRNVHQSALGSHGLCDIFQLKVLSTRKPPSRFFGSCQAKALSEKKCVPCDSKDLHSMTEESASELIQKVPGWNLQNESGVLKLHKSWKVKTFIKGLEFFQMVANVAEAEGHHPDLHLVGWNNVKIDIWTHSVGGLTENDFILAAKIDALDLNPLLRRKAKQRMD